MNKADYSPIDLETHYPNVGFKTRPAVHIGSQTSKLYKNDPLEQSIEGLHLAASLEGDVIVVRNVDPEYIDYWNTLIGKTNVINLKTEDDKTFLSDLILKNPQIVDEIKSAMHPKSTMMVYFPTEQEERLAKELGIKLHGSSNIANTYGTKSGIRLLAKKYGLTMSDGYVCRTLSQLEVALEKLFVNYDEVIIKHDISSAGRWMVKIKKTDKHNTSKLLTQILGREYEEYIDVLVAEGWVTSNASLCAHIEIVEGLPPVVAAAWQQIIGSDGVSYEGAGPHRLSQKAHDSFLSEVNKLANALYETGAIGSFGPDYIIAQNDKNFNNDTAVLIELNARVPFTAFPLEIVKFVKGKIGTGFFSHKITLPEPLEFHEVKQILSQENLLITKKDPRAKGVVPFNINLLKWKELYYVAIGDNWEETRSIAQKMKKLFSKSAT